MNLKPGTQKLREDLMQDSKRFIKEQKAKWKEEGYVLEDEIIIWCVRKARIKKKLGIEEFTGIGK